MKKTVLLILSTLLILIADVKITNAGFRIENFKLGATPYTDSVTVTFDFNIVRTVLELGSFDPKLVIQIGEKEDLSDKKEFFIRGSESGENGYCTERILGNILKDEDSFSRCNVFYTIRGSFIKPSTEYYVKGFIFGFYSGNKEAESETIKIKTKDPNYINNQQDGQVEFKSKRGYRFLAPIPGIFNKEESVPGPEECKTDPSKKLCNIGDYINTILELAIALGAVFLVIKLVIHGYKYMVSEVPFLKMQAKDKIVDSIIGIILALTAYLLLNTINPKLVESELTLEKAVLTIEEEEFDGQDVETGKKSIKIEYSQKFTENDSCPGKRGSEKDTCVKIDPSIRKTSYGDSVEKKFADKLVLLANTLKNKNIDWKVTEAWKPERVHKARCHQIGTCIDMNHTLKGGLNGDSNPPSLSVKTVIETASNLGMCAQYEVKNSSTKKTLTQGGVPPSNILVLGDWISANHYSLYAGKCK